MTERSRSGWEDKAGEALATYTAREMNAVLTAREKEVLHLRDNRDGHGETLDEVGSRFGIKKERARQVQNRAISKLYHQRAKATA